MSNIDHLAAIREALDARLHTDLDDEAYTVAMAHAGALVSELVAERASNTRWCRYFTAVHRSGDLEMRGEPWDSAESLAVNAEVNEAGRQLTIHGDLLTPETS